MADSFTPSTSSSDSFTPATAITDSFTPAPEPAWGDVLGALPTAIGSHLQQSVGGWTQFLGDLANKVVADSGEGLRETGAGIAESGRINAELGIPQNMSTGQEIVLSGGASAAQTLLLAPLGVARSVAGMSAKAAAAPVIGGMGAITAGQVYGEMREAGFGPGRSALHAGFEGLVESATEYLPAKALFGSHKNLLARTIAVMTREIPSELVATALQDVSAKLSRNPEMTIDEFLHDLVVTAGATVVGVPIQAGAVHGMLRMLRHPPPEQRTPTVLPDSEIVGPPRYTDIGTAVKEEGAGIDTTNIIEWIELPDEPTKPKGRTEGVELTGEVFARDRYRRVKDAMANGQPVAPGDMLWAKWYEQGNPGISDMPSPAQQITAIEEASKALEKAAQEAPVVQTTDGGILLPTVVGATSTTREIEPNNLPRVRDIETSAPPGTVKRIDGTEPVVPTTEARVTASPTKLEEFNAAPKRQIDLVRIEDDGKHFLLNGFVTNPARGQQYHVVSARIPKTDLGAALGDRGIGAVQEWGQGHIQTLTNVDINSAFVQRGREHIIDKAEAIKHAIEEHGVAIPGFITRAKSVSAIMPTGAIQETSYVVQQTKSRTKPHDGFNRNLSYGEYSDKHEAGEVVLVGDDSLNGLKLHKVLQSWVDKYLPEARIVLIYTQSSEQKNSSGWMKQDNDGVFYISINTQHTLAKQAATLAHEFGHVLVVDQFYKAPHATQAAMFKQYQEFLDRVPQMNVGEFMRERFDMDFSEYVTSVYNESDPASKLISAIDAMHGNGYTLSFDEYYAEQFAKYVAEPTASEFTVDPSVHSLMQETFRRLKNFFSGLSVAFREGSAFRSWVEGLALTNQQVKDAINGDNTQNKLLAKLRKAGFEDATIDALRDDNGQLSLEDVTALLKNETNARPKLRDDDFQQLNDDWAGSENVEGRISFPGMLARFASNEGHPEVAESLTTWNWAVKTFASLLQIGQLNPHVPGVQQYINAVRDMYATKGKWTSQANERIKQWQAIGKEQSDKLAKILLEESEGGKFVGTVVQTGTNSREQTYTIEGPDMERLGLREDTVALYRDIHSDYLAALNSMEVEGIHELWRIYDPDTYNATQQSGMTGVGIFTAAATHPTLAQHIQTIQQDFQRLREKPYVPFTRFGDYYVLVKATEATKWRGRDFKAGETMYFAGFDTHAQAKEHHAKMKKDTGLEYGPTSVSLGHVKTNSFSDKMRGMPASMVTALQTRLELTAEQAKELRDFLAATSSTRAFVQHLQKRTGVAGYSEDMMRVYGDYFLRFANYQARLQHGHALDKGLDQVAKSARAINDASGDATKRELLWEWLDRHREYTMKPKSELEDVRSALTVTYLALNVKSAVINGFQVPFVAVPYLSQRSSWKEAYSTVTKAYTDVFASWNQPKRLSDWEWAMMQRGMEDAFLNESFAAELANIAEGGNLLRALPVSRIGKGWEWFKTKGMWMFQRMEEINRRVTFVAALRTYKAQGMSDEQAYQESRTAIERTQGEYARWDRPEFMRGSTKSLMFMFMKFQQNMVFQMYGGDKAWLRILGMHLAVAGLMGMPFVANAKDVIKWLGKMWGLKVDLEEDARNLLADIGMNPDWVLNGVSHNAFGADLSGSLSLGRIIPGTDGLAQEGRFANRVLSSGSDVSGAGMSFILNVMQAIADDNPSTLLRFQRALPAAFQSLAKSAEILEHGGRVDRTGAVVAELTTGDAMLQALGFNPAKAATEMREFHAKKQLVLYWQTRRTALMDQYWYAAHIAKDREGVADVREAIRKFNASAPDRALAVTHDDLSRSMKTRLRTKLLREKGLTPQTRMHGVQKQMDRLYQTDDN